MGFIPSTVKSRSTLFSPGSGRGRTTRLLNHEIDPHRSGLDPNPDWDNCASIESQAVRFRSLMDELATLEKGAIENCHQHAIEIFVSAFQRFNREQLVIVLLNGDGRFISYRVLCYGNRSSVQCRFRKIFQSVIEVDASSFVLLHNHPSGVARPSKTDIHITRLIAKLSGVLDISFKDHFIVAGRAAFSMKKAGFL